MSASHPSITEAAALAPSSTRARTASTIHAARVRSDGSCTLALRPLLTSRKSSKPVAKPLHDVIHKFALTPRVR